MKLFCGATVVFCVGVVPSLGRNHYNDYYDDNDYFTETGFVLTPTDRQARDISLDFPQLEEDFTYPEVIRQERDGGFHGQHGGGGHGRRQGRRFGQQQEQRQSRQFGRLDVPAAESPRQGRNNRRQQNRNQEQFDNRDQEFDQRQGRQSGDIGLALGVLNNPPREDGSYNFNFANDDGSSRQEVGNPGSDSMLVSGSYSFITPEGEVVEMQYTADEFGYHASGSHMPTTPPPPPHVQRLLAHLAKVNGDFVY